jgi:hypothetical protein
MMKSAEPVRDDDQSWVLDLNCQKALASIRNCKLEYKGRTMCYVRKMAKDVIEVEARGTLKEEYCFALAIAAFLCPL